MNTDRETVERVVEVLDDTDACEQYEPESNIARCITAPPQSMDWWCLPCIRKYTAAMLRALLNERDEERARTAEARELAKRWRDLYEFDCIDPLPEYYFPWEAKPQILPPT